MDAKRGMQRLLVALVTLTALPSVARQQRGVTVAEYVGSVPKPNGIGGMVPEDIDESGRLLLLIQPNTFGPEPLLLFDTRSRRSLLPPINVRWPELPGATAANNCVKPVLRFLDRDGDRVAGLYGCFIIVVDIRKPAVEWSTRIPEMPHKYTLRDSVRLFVTALLAVDRQEQNFAVVVNNAVMKKPQVLLYNARSRSPFLSWPLPRFAQSAAWSPDGKNVAVLYSAVCDAHLNWWNIYDSHHFHKILTLADVEVFDATTGRPQLSFYSGGPEAKIAYSPDGKLLYCIADSGAVPMTFLPHRGRDAIRVFSSTDGKLVRAIRVPHTGVRSRFALSPDGKLIASDATTNATWVPHDPPPIAVRFVLLDAATGEKLFEHEETWGGGDATATTLMFSPDGRTLIADPLAADGEGPVEIYRVGETR